MAAIPTTTKDGSLILSLTGDQRAEYTLFSRDYSYCFSLPGSSNCALLTEKPHDILNNQNHPFLTHKLITNALLDYAKVTGTDLSKNSFAAAI